MKSGLICSASGIVMIISVFFGGETEQFIMALAYGLMFVAYVIKDKTGD